MIFAKNMLAILDSLTRKSVNCANQILDFLGKILNAYVPAPKLGNNPNPRDGRLARAINELKWRKFRNSKSNSHFGNTMAP